MYLYAYWYTWSVGWSVCLSIGRSVDRLVCLGHQPTDRPTDRPIDLRNGCVVWGLRILSSYLKMFVNHLENAITHKNFVPAAQENPLAAVLLSQLKVR